MIQRFLEIAVNRYSVYAAFALILYCATAFGHGGVMIEEDQCIIQFGFYKAHFTVYQPATSGDDEYCEDLPDSGPTVFLLYYLHNSLGQVPVDFRIIRNATGLGRFAKWSDLEKIGNLDPLSVFYQAPAVRPEGILMVEHDFDQDGEYIGIVTATHPTNGKTYRAVFPFQVGRGKFFYASVALIILALAFAQFRFRVFNRLINRIRRTTSPIRKC